MALNLAKGFEDAPDNAFICLYFDVSEIICIFAERTVKPSTLSNRGYERSEHPRRAQG